MAEVELAAVVAAVPMGLGHVEARATSSTRRTEL